MRRRCVADATHARERVCRRNLVGDRGRAAMVAPMKWSPLSFIVLVAFLSLGNTECDQFHEVTVPANDSSPPLAVGSAYQLFLSGPFPGYSVEALMHSWEPDGGVLYQHSGERIPLAAVASSIDDGGAKRVRMTGVMHQD